MPRYLLRALWALSVGTLLLLAGAALADDAEPPVLSPDEESSPLFVPVVNPTGTCQRCDRDLRELPPGSGNLVWVWACFPVSASPTFNSSRHCTANSTGCTQTDWCVMA